MSVAQTVSVPTSNLNSLVLAETESMPVGGGYSATHRATVRLQDAASLEGGTLLIQADAAVPSYCSGATYLVFLKVLEALHARGELQLDQATLSLLPVRGQRDGDGIWGRWNANGPGTARLFRELNLGPNFSSFSDALPGDFMKIFWTSEVGAAEHGHSVVFLGTDDSGGVKYVRFWSSNEPAGYGVKRVPLARVQHAIFSRLEAPGNLSRIGQIPRSDPYLASLQKRRSSFQEAADKCGL